LDPAQVGEFDLIMMGYVLQMLRDPLRALEAVRRFCRGRLILLETVSRPLDLLPAPLARLDARRDGSEWFVFNRRSLRKVLELIWSDRLSRAWRGAAGMGSRRRLFCALLILV
jgi:ubiquinone/menaquinone biosynthesis C-methylase UbiE